MAPMCVVLDLDETLIHYRQGMDEAGALAQLREGVDYLYLGDKTPVLLRPGYYGFLSFLLKHFDEIYVYTAGSDLYAREIVSVIFHKQPLVHLWTQDSCRRTADGGVIKPLRGKRSLGGLSLDSADTIMIDDRPEVVNDNIYVKRQNHFVVPQFKGAKDDIVLSELQGQILAWIKARKDPRINLSDDTRFRSA
jgi:hypothetical protein